MATPEILLLAGAPGSGKTSIAKAFVAMGEPEGARHLSIGDQKRLVMRGETPSAYAELLRHVAHPDRTGGTSPSEAMIGIMEEFLLAQPGGLVVVDGFPRYLDRLAPFTSSMHRIGAHVLALCVVELDEAALSKRLADRPVRPGQQKIKTPAERLADHRANIIPTLGALARMYPHYTLDGALPLDANARRLREIYYAHSDHLA